MRRWGFGESLEARMSVFVREEWFAWPFLASLSSLCGVSGLDVFSWRGKAYWLPRRICISRPGRSVDLEEACSLRSHRSDM